MNPTDASVKPGDLGERVTLEALDASERNSLGESVESFARFCDCWANVDEGATRTFLLAQQNQPELAALVTIRWRPGIESGMRLTHRGRCFRVDGPPKDPTGFRQWLQLTCVHW